MTSGVSARVARDFRLATRGGPFRVALTLSLIVHLVALFILGRAGVKREGALLMHVRLLAAEPVPEPVPAAPAITPPANKPRREQPGELAALVPATPAAVPPPAAAQVLAVVDAPAPAPESVALGEARGREAIELAAVPANGGAPGSPQPQPQLQLQVQSQPNGVVDVPAPSISAAAAPAAPTPAAGIPGTASAAPTYAPTAAETGPGGSTATGLAGAGLDTAGVAAAQAGAADTVAAATGARRGPGSRDLAAVQHRIDARKVYPQIAVRNGWEGRVLVEMHLEGDGSLTDVRLLEGSGYTVLDDATITAVRRASPFPPIARVLHVPVEYRLVP